MEHPDQPDRGGRFFAAVVQRPVIGEPEGEILLEIALVLKLLDRLQAELDRTGPVVEGRLSPVVVELRQQRTLLAKLISLLPPAVPPARPNPQSHRVLAKLAGLPRSGGPSMNTGAG